MRSVRQPVEHPDLRPKSIAHMLSGLLFHRRDRESVESSLMPTPYSAGSFCLAGFDGNVRADGRMLETVFAEQVVRFNLSF